MRFRSRRSFETAKNFPLLNGVDIRQAAVTTYQNFMK